MKTAWVRGCLLLPLLLLAACKMDLYSDLSEQDANEMLAVLLDHGINCDKTPAKDGWTLQVNRNDMASAVTLLKSLGYPRQTYTNLGQIFEKEGLISSPREERIRFNFGKSQELSATLAQIDGVLAARVHIVLPERDPLGETTTPASASIFIKYHPDSDVTAQIPQMKHLVVNSIAHLDTQQVSVALFPGDIPERIPAPEQPLQAGMNQPIFWLGTLLVLLSTPVMAIGVRKGWRPGGRAAVTDV